MKSNGYAVSRLVVTRVTSSVAGAGEGWERLEAWRNQPSAKEERPQLARPAMACWLPPRWEQFEREAETNDVPASERGIYSNLFRLNGGTNRDGRNVSRAGSSSSVRFRFSRDRPDGNPHARGVRLLMLGWALTFLVIAIIAAIFGFGGVAGTAAGIAQVLFYIFLAIFVISLLFGLARGRRP